MREFQIKSKRNNEVERPNSATRITPEKVIIEDLKPKVINIKGSKI